MWLSVCVSCVASVCSFVVEKACGRRRIEPTLVKEWYPLRKWTADGMSPPRVGSKMQDYDHWDALVIGEWPPGRSGPPGVCHTPSLFYLSSSVVLFLALVLSLSFHVMCSCCDEFHFSFRRSSYQFACREIACHWKWPGRWILFKPTFCVVCRSHMYMSVYVCIMYIDLGFVLTFSLSLDCMH